VLGVLVPTVVSLSGVAGGQASGEGCDDINVPIVENAEMITRTMTVGPLSPGQQVVISHGLSQAGTLLVPTTVLPDFATTIAVVGIPTSTTVTFKNNGTASATANFRIRREHSIQSDGTDTLYWRGASSSGGGAPAASASLILGGDDDVFGFNEQTNVASAEYAVFGTPFIVSVVFTTPMANAFYSVDFDIQIAATNVAYDIVGRTQTANGFSFAVRDSAGNAVDLANVDGNLNFVVWP
jgi:hypothetical protein